MKIGILHQAVGRHGGAERFCIDVSRKLKEQGNEVTLFWHDWNMDVGLRTLTELYDDTHRIVYPVPWRSYHIDHLASALRKCDVICVTHHVNPRIGWLVTKLLKGKIPLAWYAGEPNRGLWEKWITSSARTKEMRDLFRATVTRIYGRYIGLLMSYFPFHELATGFLRAVDFTYVRSFDLVMPQSRCVAKALRRIYKISFPYENVVYPGIDPNRFLDYEQETDRLNSETEDLCGKDYFLAVGVLSPQKNYATMFQAFELAVSKTNMRNVELVVAGDGPLKAQLVRHTKQVREKARIRLLGHVSLRRLTHLYKNCRALVHTAFWESFGLTPLEAGLFSKPSIVSEIGGPAETVEDGVTGLHVDPYSAQDISEALCILLSNPAMARHLGENAARKVRTEFIIDVTAESITRHLKALTP